MPTLRPLNNIKSIISRQQDYAVNNCFYANQKNSIIYLLECKFYCW